MVVDKRVAGIICWLERLKKSYSSGAMEVALMDAECARADLEILRADVWKQVKPKEKNKIYPLALNFAKSFVLAVIIVMLMVFPISREINLPLPVIEKKEKLVLAEPIIVIREYDQPAPAPQNQNHEAKISKSSKRLNVSQPQKIAKAEKSEKVEAVEKAVKVEKKVKTVPYDEIFSLVQTGHQALKKDNSVIKIK